MINEIAGLTNDEIHKELDLLHDVIKQMSENSFKVKAWMMAITGGVLALTKDILFVVDDTKVNYPSVIFVCIFLLIMIICFWWLDAFFLKTEKSYRELYKWVITNRKTSNEYLFDINTFERPVKGVIVDLSKKVKSVFYVMFSKTLWMFYLIPIFFVLFVLVRIIF